MQGAEKIDPEIERLFTQHVLPTCICKASQIPACGVPTTETSLQLSDNNSRSGNLGKIQDLLRDIIQMEINQLPDLTLATFREEYLKLDWESRQKALLLFATQFGVDAARLFEQINKQPCGLKFLVHLRADLIAAIKEKNLSALHALDADLKGMFETWVVPACLELQQITWTNSASVLKTIVVHETTHPVRNLDDLKRRLSVGRRCYGYFHPEIPGEPVVFIELALTNKLEGSIQNVLYGEPPLAEEVATTAIFYALTHSQTGLAGIDLGSFLLREVITVLRQDRPSIQNFCTLSPINGFSKWLLPKLESQIRFAQVDSRSSQDIDGAPAFKENLLLPEEEDILVKACSEFSGGGKSRSGLQIIRELLTSRGHEWTKSAKVAAALRAPLMRLCARYLILEKKDGRPLNLVTHLHVWNGASVERLNWMADTSTKGIEQSAGIMVTYIYRLENLDTNKQLYLNKGIISVSPAIQQYLHGLVYNEKEEMQLS
ncbi:hypothetical protein R1sor_013430 [Riccia sorocarpa]|uniref:Malonyl-CoA decarboxylase n=1 Tax=Riccia sorocarpa TaxID=122646 RepID=A0ABD3H8I9_9MARC